MATEIYEFKITALSSVLMNNPTSMGSGESDSPTKAKRTYDPKTEAEKRTYRLKGKNGQLYIPAMAFRRALLKACVNRKIGKISAYSAVSAGVFTLDDGEECPLFHKKTKKPLTDYRIHDVRVVVGPKKDAVMRQRPEIVDWSCILRLSIDSDFVTVGQVLTLMNLAGKMIGVMDWRVEKGGKHGRYTAEPYSAATRKAIEQEERARKARSVAKSED